MFFLFQNKLIGLAMLTSIHPKLHFWNDKVNDEISFKKRNIIYP